MALFAWAYVSHRCVESPAAFAGCPRPHLFGALLSLLSVMPRRA
ncbi:hypothetical protein MINT15_07490 [Saccharomonospora viridis]|uniref:Uncharacterized protein n=1 Tax=Saccharomonospora viridis TaxID=1852 RepID=A0A837DDX3_9PSEU|nr:hypothetical protein MINT15_07490 [Saccharomonospora viridis]